MKTKTLLFALFFTYSLLGFGQTYIWESFDAGQMPPSGWTIDGLPAQWAVNNSANAGGSAPEAQFTYVQQTTTSRFVSPMCDLTGLTSVKLSFRHMYDWYSNPAPKCGVATRSHNGAWTTVWEKSPTANIAAEQIEVIISNSDVGQSEFQICFYLNGNMYNMDYWFIDNILLYNPLNLDAGIISLVATPTYFADPIQVKGTIMNLGTSTINGAELQYTVDNGPVNTTTISGLSMATEDMYDFTLDQFMTGSIGPHELTVWINKVNGDKDDNPANDTLRKTAYKICYVVPRKPLYEEFTSSTCAPCASFNTSFVPWCNTNEDSITLVKYQMSWPAPGDPYYTLEGGVRRTFYGVNAVPDLYVNGGNTGTNIGSVIQAFNQSKMQIGMMKIAGTHSLTGTTMTIDATVLPFSDFNNVRVYIVVMEKVTHNNHMSNGETSFEHVMMKMVPDAEGITTNLADRVPFTVHQVVDLAGTHVEEFTDLIVGIFVQDHSSKEVFQSAYSVENAVFSTEARLSNLSSNGTTIAGFSPDTYDYSIVIPGGSMIVPTITATPVVASETVIIVPALSIPGTTTIDVFAENLIAHNLYSVNFEWAVGQGDAMTNDIQIYPNPSKGNVFIYGVTNASLSVYNSVGAQVVQMENFSGNSLNLSHLTNGVYLLKIERADHSVIQKKIVIM